MLDKLFRSNLHEHADPAQRLLGIAELPPEAEALARLLRDDPAPEVRAAAAARCADLSALAAAWRTETAAEVRAAIAGALSQVLADTSDDAAARDLIAAPECDDAIRAQVAMLTHDDERRRRAIEGIGSDEALVDVALGAVHAATRMAAAERVRAEPALRRLADAAKDKDRGVARLARQRVQTIDRRAADAAQADAILEQIETLAAQPGPIVMAAVELDRRWRTLDLAEDTARRTRWEAANAGLLARFEREQQEHRAQLDLRHRLDELLAGLQAPPATSELPALKEALAALQAQAGGINDTTAMSKIDEARQRIARWEQALPALEAAEALVAEAEGLAEGTGIDNAQLAERWQAIELSLRTPALTRRFEAALLAIEQRRLALARAAQQQEGTARHELHAQLHAAEQALAQGQVHAARAAADQVRALKPAAGTLPKPTIQRLSRVVNQVVELERWESFGQHTARVQLCERAEALAAQTLPPAQLAKDVQGLRAEWKVLDQQHAGVPKSLWQRFDSACEKAYAPAARHFAELAAQRRQARQQREEFIAAAAAHAPSLLAEPRDLRAIERWMRETDHVWHGGTLGSVEPGTWKKLDARMKSTLAPLREALSGARAQAAAERRALIEQAQAWAEKAFEREAPSQIRALQTRWQEHAKAEPLTPREERALWQQFRTACNAVFEQRDSKRKEVEERGHEARRALQALCEQMEQLARTGDTPAAELRRAQRELQERWKAAHAGPGSVPAALDTRFRDARSGVEAMLGARASKQQTAVWHALLAREQLCSEVDALAQSRDAQAPDEDELNERWAALPAVSPAWERVMLARRDAALRAFADEDARFDYAEHLEQTAASRRDLLLEIELLLGLDSPAEVQAQRLALQVKLLRDRFKAAAVDAGTPAQRLIDWCSQPGVSDALDRSRCERIVAALERRR